MKAATLRSPKASPKNATGVTTWTAKLPVRIGRDSRTGRGLSPRKKLGRRCSSTSRSSRGSTDARSPDAGNAAKEKAAYREIDTTKAAAKLRMAVVNSAMEKAVPQKRNIDAEPSPVTIPSAVERTTDASGSPIMPAAVASKVPRTIRLQAATAPFRQIKRPRTCLAHSPKAIRATAKTARDTRKKQLNPSKPSSREAGSSPKTVVLPYMVI